MHTFNVGDLVRINRGKRRDKTTNRWKIDTGPTLWEIVDLSSDGLGCFIRESGTTYAAQRFDTAHLVKVAG